LTNPQEFQKFCDLLGEFSKELILIPLKKHSKLPDVPSGLSWLDIRLTPQQAVERLKEGKNVGVVGNGVPDGYIIIDIDAYEDLEKGEELKKALPPTLVVRTPSGGYHLYYSVKEYFQNAKAKPPYHGELRARNQYVVAPGSEVVSKSGELKTYTIEREALPALISKEQVPKTFQPASFVEDLLKIASHYVDPKPVEKVMKEAKNKHGWTLETIAGLDSKLFSLLVTPSKTKEEAMIKGYSSISEEDYATVAKLKFYEFDDKTIYDIMLSCRFREKFRKHKTYLDRTIQRCVPERTISEITDFESWQPIHINENIQKESEKYVIVGRIEDFLNRLSDTNFVKKMILHCSKRTSAYKEYFFFGALFTLSSIAERNIVVNITPEPITLKLWSVLYGESSTSHKTTSLNIIKSIMRSTRLGKKIYEPVNFSSEGFLSHLGNIIKHGKSENKELKDSIYFLVLDEFGGFLANLNQKYNQQAKEIFMLLYDDRKDGSEIARDLSQYRVVIRNDYITLIGATTPVRLARHVTPEDASSGLLPRIIPVIPTYSKEERPIKPFDPAIEEEEIAISAYINKLYTLISTYKSMTGKKLRLSFSDVALGKYNKFCDEVLNAVVDNAEGDEKDLLSPFMSRLRQHILKIAGLLYLGSSDFYKELSERLNSLEKKEPLKSESSLDLFADYNRFDVPDVYMDFTIDLSKEIIINYIKLFVSEIALRATNSAVDKVYYLIKKMCMVSGSNLVPKNEVLKRTGLDVFQFNKIVNTLIVRGDITIVIKEGKKGRKEYIKFLR